MASKKVTVCIVDPHPIVRQCVRYELENAGFKCWGEFSSAEECNTAINQGKHSPNIVVTEQRLPGESGVQLVSDLSARFPKIHFIAFSGEFAEVFYALRFSDAGASAYVSKKLHVAELITAIKAVAEGKRFFSEAVKSSNGLKCKTRLPHRLSPRQLAVFELVGQGLTSKQIGARLDVSSKTIEAHRENIKTKLGLQCAQELLYQATLYDLNR